jgi:molybdopterin converting factor small subunit
VITVQAEYTARFKEITQITSETIQLEQPHMAELAQILTTKYGERMEALLIDPKTQDLNTNGTLFVDSTGRRLFIDDTLADGETVSFMVGIAGG